MKRFILLTAILTTLIFYSCNKDKYVVREMVDENGYSYEKVTNDPTDTRVYTLDNGLKVYLSVNKDEPRIMTYISVRSGSLNDPEETTGLAHYFEHLLFKGTAKFGTSNWEKEKVYLDSISDLFEQHKNAATEEEKKAIYKEIDRLSQIASRYAIPNEYDRMTSAIGATGTNAFTSYETTTYVNEIPSNELKRWLEMEQERFTDPVLRLFHTELETVYEEFNMSQDRDMSRERSVLMENLFPNNPLGRDIIGYPKDLKNPSQKNIMEFFHTWYVPNNMAVILSGDLDYDKTIQLVDSTFGKFKSKPLPEIKHTKEEPITHVIEKEVYGPEAENVMFAYRFNGEKSEDRKYVYMIDMILNNSVAGLIDLDLVQKQKVLNAGCGPSFQSDYGMHMFYGVPKEGQTLEEVKDLIQGEIEKVKKGEFEDWLMDAVNNNFKVDMIKRTESNNRVSLLLDAFVYNMNLAELFDFYNQVAKITKDELVAFANEHYKDNYVVVYKRNGEPGDVVKVEKPQITSVEINRDIQSDYLKHFLSEKTDSIEPVFVNFDEMLERKELEPGLELDYIKNTTNDLFEMDFIWDMGDRNDKKLALAMSYLQFLGTDHYTAEEISKEFYKMGITFDSSVGGTQSTIKISGLSEKMLQGLELVEHLLASAKPDSAAYESLVDRILKSRSDQKKNPGAIRTAILNYAKYGPVSPITDILSEDDLRSMNPQDLTDAIAEFNSFKHRVFYYGPQMAPEVANIIKKHHRVEGELADCPAEKKFTTNDFTAKNVLYLNYPKTQVDVLYLSKDVPYNEKVMVDAHIFNEYYGGNMSSIVFQEIREAKALAYSAWAGYITPKEKDDNFFIQGVIYTQADKMLDAVSAMDGLLETMVMSENPFNIACNNIIKNIQTDRITKQRIFWTWLANEKKGIDHDIRKDYYEAAQTMTLDDVQNFFDEHIKDKKYTYVIIGDQNIVTNDKLKSIAPVKTLTLEDVFGF
ncbi:M16 family metallopeptidase [Saccharicrinis sp. FJH62]|uniref:M16 family metallopeptidase n=1 Tax=Saccharicrinis sp. FJH62 TaxID=3344657 RepID=UPI0035D4E70E